MTIRDCLLSVLLGLAVPGCSHTYIDLNPDVSGEDSATDDGAVDDGEDAGVPEGEVEAADATEGDGAETVILPPPPCGNGVMDDGEECDDGNRENEDGCTWDCLLGDGDPPGPRDPTARPYVVEGPPVILEAAEHAPTGASAGMSLSTMDDATLVASWYRRESPIGDPATIASRFLLADGALARADVGIELSSGWQVSGLAQATRATDFLLAWRAGVDGMWRARLTVGGGLVEAATLLLDSPDSDLPALASQSAGYAMAWYEGTDTIPCVHDGAGPSRIFLRRLGPDGSLDMTQAPIELEAELGARTSPRLASGGDSTVGLLWWRAGTEAASDCTLRFGAANPGLTWVADGGVVGLGNSGRVVDAEEAYRMVWRLNQDPGPQRLNFAASDRGAMLLDAPTDCDLPFQAFWGDLELAAGDHGLLTVLRGWDEGLEQRLFFVRTDLMGRAGDASCGALEVDPSCTAALGCEPGPFGVAWAGDAFVVVYFVTLDPTGPSPTTEMRMVRLVPAP